MKFYTNELIVCFAMSRLLSVKTLLLLVLLFALSVMSFKGFQIIVIFFYVSLKIKFNVDWFSKSTSGHV